MKRIIFFAIFFLIFNPFMYLNAQLAITYGGSDEDVANSIQQTSDEGYIVTGYTVSFGAGGSDFWVLKLSLAGDIEWEHNYGGSDEDVANSIQQTSDEGYIVAGFTASFGAGGFDFWVLKLSSEGDIDWQYTYGGSQDDVATSIQETSDEGYIVAGYTYSFVAGSSKFWILKLSSAGDIDWQRDYGGSGDDVANSIQETSDEEYIVAGYTNSFGAGESDFWVLKLSSNGDIDWECTYGGSGDDVATSIQETSDEEYIVAGYTNSFGAGESDFLILKLSSNGDIDWERTYGGSGDDVATSIQETSDGGYIVSGFTNFFGAGESDFLIQKLSSNGDIEPLCELIGSSDATVLVTYAIYGDTYTIPQNTYISSQDTYISPQDTYATANLLCEARPSISGVVKTEQDEAIEGVTITLSDEGGTATTNSDGSYSHTVSYGWSGTATPTKNCYTFSPPSLSYTNVTSDQTDQDYTGIKLTYKISGIVSLASSPEEPLSGVVMDGLPGSPTTDASGYYEATVDCGWSGSVTPTRERYIFSPSSRSYTDVSSDHTDQDYTAYPGWIISGLVRTEEGEEISGVTITFSNEGGTATTNSEGSYSHTVREGWSGTATPSKAGYTFSPSIRDYTNVTSDQPNQNYTGTFIPYTLTINAGTGGATQPSPGNYTHYYGTQVSITAIPDSGYKFSHWSGNVPSAHENDNPLTIIMDSDKSITANFTAKEEEPFWKDWCFIAAAVYDSPLHPYVRILRDFRDKYFMPNKLGRALVYFYYKYSPFVADLIAKNKVLKVAARISLLPVIFFSYAMLHLGPAIFAVIIFFIFVLPVFFVCFYQRKVRIYRGRIRKVK